MATKRQRQRAVVSENFLSGVPSLAGLKWHDPLLSLSHARLMSAGLRLSSIYWLTLKSKEALALDDPA